MDWIDELNKELEERRERNQSLKAKAEALKRQHQWIASIGGHYGGSKNRDNKHGLFSLTPEQKREAGIKGGKASIDNLIKWCEENNHWDTLAILQKGYEKSEEHKQKISETLTGRTLSDETKQKMSQSRMGHGWSDEAIENLKKGARKRCRPVLQFDLDGNFIKEWDGFAHIVDELKVSKSPIYACCKGYTKKAHNFIWKYKDES